MARHRRVNYVIPTWGGERQWMGAFDGYLQRHIDQLSGLKHSLTQVTVCHPKNHSERPEFRNYVNSLKVLANGTPIVVLDTENIGRAYGQWSHVYKLYRNLFDYYIFIEDDYMPVVDYFDDVMCDLYQEARAQDNCGYLCGVVLDERPRWGYHSRPLHAAVVNGVASAPVLAQVWERFGELPHDHGNYANGQVLFSQGFTRLGYTLHDWLHKYRTTYWDAPTKRVRIFGRGSDLLIPYQQAAGWKDWDDRNPPA